MRILLAFLLLPLGLHAQQKYLLPNEQVIFSFQNEYDEKMVLAKDTANAYIVYRFGTTSNVEMEYPAKNKDSWDKFTYSYYFRGGQVDNAGLDVNYLTFVKGDTRYVIYETYTAENNESEVGLKIIEPRNNVTNIHGIYRKRRGSIHDLRYNTLVPMGDELFD